MGIDRAVSFPFGEEGHPRKTALREVVNAIQCMFNTGCRWWAIPRCFPAFTTVQNYFYARCRNGIFERMMDTVRALGRALAGRSETSTDI